MLYPGWGNEYKTNKAILLWVAVIFFLVSWHAMTEATMYAQAVPEKKYSDTKTRLPDFKLPVPADRSDREYLGISGKDTFRIGQINAQIVIIEVFSFHCPICQPQAPLVNELYNKIQADPNLRDKVKIIGIAATNNPFEARSFKESHRVPFPVFSDEDSELAIALKYKIYANLYRCKGRREGIAGAILLAAGGIQGPLPVSAGNS